MGNNQKFVSRAGEKLLFALKHFKVSVSGLVCADFGSAKGGFADVLLQNGALQVYAIETGYGVLDWNLRNNPRVIVLERTNAMHVTLPQKVDFISVDVSWTPQAKIIPNALRNLKSDGVIISLIKPHYEAEKRLLRSGVLPEKYHSEVLGKVVEDIKEASGLVAELVKSPIAGQKGGNIEYLAYVKKAQPA